LEAAAEFKCKGIDEIWGVNGDDISVAARRASFLDEGGAFFRDESEIFPFTTAGLSATTATGTSPVLVDETADVSSCAVGIFFSGAVQQTQNQHTAQEARVRIHPPSAMGATSAGMFMNHC
jgi:hypothetical protein